MPRTASEEYALKEDDDSRTSLATLNDAAGVRSVNLADFFREPLSPCGISRFLTLSTRKVLDPPKGMSPGPRFLAVISTGGSPSCSSNCRMTKLAESGVLACPISNDSSQAESGLFTIAEEINRIGIVGMTIRDVQFRL